MMPTAPISQEVPTKPMDLTACVRESTIRVFCAFLALEVSPCLTAPTDESQRTLVGTVGLAGDFCGVVCLHVRPKLAAQLAAVMFQIEAADEVPPEDIKDVMGEVTNVLAGEIKRRLACCGTIVLSVPTIISGYSLDVSSLSGVHKAVFLCQQNGEPVLAELYNNAHPPRNL
jgi:chemotaxis protein CheX